MIHYKYSPKQLEEKAEELLRRFDAERLVKTKPLDVYAVIEKCLDVPYDWKYLTPDQSILGLTVFKSGYAWVWPKSYYEDGMKPEKVYFEKNTIVIDSTLTEMENCGPENFTVIHEVFHQVLHKRCFAHCNPDYTHSTTKKSLALTPGKTYRTSLEINESQANLCAACFLMPRLLVTEMTHRLYPSGKLDLKVSRSIPIVKELADMFSVSPTAMKIRLKTLGLAI